MTQGQAARLFGGGPVAFSKYENDDVAQSESMDNLLRLVRRSADAFWQLVQEKGMAAEFTKQTEIATTKRVAEIHVLDDYRPNNGKVVYKPTTFQSYPSETRKWK
jgi:HTH-type transcriptional regulator / antitoxin MqsA